MSSLVKKRSIIVIFVVILVLAIILSSFLFLNSQKPYNGNVESITVGMENNQVNLLLYIADKQGYFNNNGLNLTIKDYSSGAAATNGMLNGEVNVATATEFVLTRNILSNYNIQTFGSLNKFLQSYVIAAKDRGIQNISDLKGKTIGVTLQTNSEFYVGRFLELNNLDLSQVNLTNIPPSQLTDALTNGTVDAVVAWQPYVGEIQNRLGNDSVVMWDAHSGQAAYDCIIGMDNWAADHPKTAKSFLNALSQAEDYVLNNPTEAKTMLQNWLNLSVTYVQTIWPQYSFALSLEQSQLLAMQDEGVWLMSNNLTNATSLPNFLNYVYLDGLEAVKPSAVTIIK